MGRATDALKRVPTAEYSPLKRAQDAIAVLLAKSAHLQRIHTPSSIRSLFAVQSPAGLPWTLASATPLSESLGAWDDLTIIEGVS